MSVITYLNPDVIKDASIEGIKLKDGSVSASKIDSSVASKKYVDDTIASAISASDAMVFKGTIGTGGTSESLPSTAIVGDTYKVIALTTIPGTSSYTGAEETAKVGDLIVAISAEPKWIVVPSGDEAIDALERHDALVQLITWSDLKAKRDAGSLIPGMQYRITDYQCTTVLSGTKSAGHQFDIIVVADDESTLNETARAIKHPVAEGETDYFANNNLSTWQIWYCLDNDTTRFAWADSTNGKGVIYRMIDEFNNDVPYDFKNIQFYRQWDSSKSLWSTIPADNTGVPCYTFSSEGNSDTTSFTDTSLNKSATIFNMVYSNAIKSCINPENGKNLYLNNNCFFGTGCGSNTFGNECFANTFGPKCGGNTFGNNCYSNTFGTYCNHNTFGDTFHDNTFGSWCYDNTFSFGCSDITFGNNCYSNTFGPGCSNIKFASDKEATTKYTYYRNNHFGADCGFIIFTGTGTAGELGQVQNYNFAQGLQGAPRTYLTIDGVRNRSYETKVARNSEGTIKTYCEADLIQ